MSHAAVADVVMNILKRPHHRARWEAWSRPGATGKRPRGGDDEGAQSCIAWVVDDFRWPDAGERWSQVGESPSSRSAVQRFFSIGATPSPTFVQNGPIEQCTRSQILIAIVDAFDFATTERDEVLNAFTVDGLTPSWDHLGRSVHTWETARSDEDLRGVIELSRRIIGGSAGFKPPGPHPPNADDIAPLRRRLDIRPDGLEVCLRQHIEQDVETLVGYMLAYPLDADATQAILRGQVSSAEEIDDQQVATTILDEASLYIGMVLGADLPARAAVMDRCLQRATSWGQAHPTGFVLAKRSTNDGERWLESYSFVPVADRDGIWVRDPSAPATRRRKRRLIAASS